MAIRGNWRHIPQEIVKQSLTVEHRIENIRNFFDGGTEWDIDATQSSLYAGMYALEDSNGDTGTSANFIENGDLVFFAKPAVTINARTQIQVHATKGMQRRSTSIKALVVENEPGTGVDEPERLEWKLTPSETIEVADTGNFSGVVVVGVTDYLDDFTSNGATISVVTHSTNITSATYDRDDECTQYLGYRAARDG